MSNKSNLSRLFMALPAILLMSFMNVFIASSVAQIVLIQLMTMGYKNVALGTAIFTAVIVYAWITFNHKLRVYIKSI